MLCNYFDFRAKQEGSIVLGLGERTGEPDFLGVTAGLQLSSCVSYSTLYLTSQWLIFLICKTGIKMLPTSQSCHKD